MATIKQQVTFFNDSVGRVLPGAQIFTYVAGDINTPKNTYTDKTLNFANTWPVVADANGIFPVMWAELGDYLLVYTDADDVEFARRDDVSTGESVGLSAPTFNTVSDLVSGATFSGETVSVSEGTICRTEGEVTVRDSRASDWIVVAAGPTIDNYKYFALDNGLVAERLTNIVSGMQTCSFFMQSNGDIEKQICSNSTQLDLISGVVKGGTGIYTISFNYDIDIYSIQGTIIGVSGMIACTYDPTSSAESDFLANSNAPAGNLQDSAIQFTITFKV